MHIGKSYRLPEFLLWTRRNMFWPLIVGTIATAFYQLLNLKWLAIPWTVSRGLIGTATAFIVGFKNLQTYNRTLGGETNLGSSDELPAGHGESVEPEMFLIALKNPKEIIYRHFAWLTALRYQLREGRQWETATKAHSREYKKFYSIPETEISLKEELAKYISNDELEYILTTKNRAGQLLSLQSKTIKELYDTGLIDDLKFSAMHEAVRDFFGHQGRSERIKNFPYPRQYAIINTIFVKLFCFLLPFGMLGEFDKLNEGISGFLFGKMVWLVIPFSVLISWIYTSLEQVGESTENPFEGGANDVPISQMSRIAEIDIREMLGETDLPPALQPKINIIL